MAPQLGNGSQVDAKGVFGAQQRQALSERRHHAVFDAVVNHLGEVPCPRSPGMQPACAAVCLVAAAGSEHAQIRSHGLQRLGTAADHQAIAVGQAVDTAGHACVHEMHARSLALRGAAHRVAVVAVGTVHDGVAL